MGLFYWTDAAAKAMIQGKRNGSIINISSIEGLRAAPTFAVYGACVYLASDLAAWVTGITLSVDGGTWASSGWTRDPTGAWSLFHE